MWWLSLIGILIGVAVGIAVAPKGWRTIVVNWLMLAGAAVPDLILALIDMVHAGTIDLAAYFPSYTLPILGAVIAFVNDRLRRATNTPAGQAVPTPVARPR